MIIVDMNLSPEWATLLCKHGLESVHWRQLGRAPAEDREIFDHAGQMRAIILTQDLDFGVILSQTNATSPSVVLLRMADVDPVNSGRLVVGALRTCARELADGAILTIDHNRHRIRILPLSRET